jgi:hypothetical protein
MRNRLLSFATLLLVPAAASAAIIYAPNNISRPYPFLGPDELIRFDSANPSGYEVIGSMNVPDIGFGGMEFDAAGNLWAYASFFKSTGGAAGGLYRVDMLTGQATRVGNSNQPLDDLAFNPVDNTMYGIRSQGSQNRLYRVDLQTGATSLVGLFTGGPSTPASIGLAIDSKGKFYVHDQSNDTIYLGEGLSLTPLYALADDTFASQGMTIDWSRDDMGYHAAVGRGVFPEYFSQVNTFTTDGSAYTLGSAFGPNEHFPDDIFGYPIVQPGDLAIAPLPEPSTAALLLLSAVVTLHRRRQA